MRRGFTLIELLIVIAIIAILALIAIPNFLEAQVRSRVARVQADLRTIATAIETYTVDYNRPPVGTKECQRGIIPASWGGAEGVPNGILLKMWRQITTPVAYLTSIPRDPFIKGGLVKPDGTVSNDLFEYQTYKWSDPTNQPNSNSKVYNLKGYTWSLASMGPTRVDGSAENALPGNLDWVYDPTNGTMSSGMIIRTNKGDFASDSSKRKN